MDEISLKRGLSGLSMEDAQVLYWRCSPAELSDKQIADKIIASDGKGRKEGWVWQSCARLEAVLNVLGYDAQVKESKTIPISIPTEVCDAIIELADALPSDERGAANWLAWPPEVEELEEQIQEEEIQEVGAAAVFETEPEPRFTIPPWLTLERAAAILGVLVVVLAVYFIATGGWDIFNGGDPTEVADVPPTGTPTLTPEPEETLPAQVGDEPTPLPAPTNTVEPTQTPQPTSTIEPSFTPSITPTPTDTPIPTDTPTATPSPTPKPFCEQGEWCEVADGVYFVLREDFGAPNYVMCRAPDPGFNLILNLEKEVREYFMQYEIGDFSVIDDLGSEYPVEAIGSNYSICSDNPQQQDVQIRQSNYLMVIAVSGSIPQDAQYLFLTIERLSGRGPFVFRKNIR